MSIIDHFIVRNATMFCKNYFIFSMIATLSFLVFHTTFSASHTSKNRIKGDCFLTPSHTLPLVYTRYYDKPMLDTTPYSEPHKNSCKNKVMGLKTQIKRYSKL